MGNVFGYSRLFRDEEGENDTKQMRVPTPPKYVPPEVVARHCPFEPSQKKRKWSDVAQGIPAKFRWRPTPTAPTSSESA